MPEPGPPQEAAGPTPHALVAHLDAARRHGDVDPPAAQPKSDPGLLAQVDTQPVAVLTSYCARYASTNHLQVDDFQTPHHTSPWPKIYDGGGHSPLQVHLSTVLLHWLGVAHYKQRVVGNCHFQQLANVAPGISVIVDEVQLAKLERLLAASKENVQPAMDVESQLESHGISSFLLDWAV